MKSLLHIRRDETFKTTYPTLIYNRSMSSISNNESLSSSNASNISTIPDTDQLTHLNNYNLLLDYTSSDSDTEKTIHPAKLDTPQADPNYLRYQVKPLSPNHPIPTWKSLTPIPAPTISILKKSQLEAIARQRCPSAPQISGDRKSTRLNSSHPSISRMPSSA